MRPGPKPKPAAEKLWGNVRIGDPDECWPWLPGVGATGYGYVSLGLYGKDTIGAHRLAYKLTYGEIPVGLFVLHRCDNPRCCNPKHLYAGTQADNMRDTLVRNRRKLHRDQLPADVRDILKNSGRPVRTLAREYGVSRSLIRTLRTSPYA